jgi:hypothetical protein
VRIGSLLAVGNVAEIFEWGSRAVKLYKSSAGKSTAFREAALHASVEAMGLPVPPIWGVQQIGNRWGLVFDRVAGESFAERMLNNPDQVSLYLECMIGLHTRVHAHAAIQFPHLKVRISANIRATALLDDQQQQHLLNGIAHKPDGDRLCHGDFHPMNILGEASQPVIIDWADARRGDPAADVCRSYLLTKLHAPEIAAPYLDGYCRATGMDREVVLNWLPYVAAAKLAEGVASERAGLLKIVDSSVRT